MISYLILLLRAFFYKEKEVPPLLNIPHYKIYITIKGDNKINNMEKVAKILNLPPKECTNLLFDSVFGLENGTIIKNGLSDIEVARIKKALSDLDGIHVGVSAVIQAK
jgi:hypothetical protein